MSKIQVLSVFALVALMLTSCKQAPKSDEAKTTGAKEVSDGTGAIYKVDPAASSIMWIGTKVSGYHVGEVKIKSGELTVNNGNIVGGNFVMDMTTILTTGPKSVGEGPSAKLTGHLKSGDFFDVEKYPEAKFEITNVKPFNGTIADDSDPRQTDITKYKVTNPTHTVSGNLTMKDVTKNISFPARVAVGENNVEALAKFNIDRRQWGITYPGQPDDLIRDDIHLGIELKATR